MPFCGPLNTSRQCWRQAPQPWQIEYTTSYLVLELSLPLPCLPFSLVHGASTEIGVSGGNMQSQEASSLELKRRRLVFCRRSTRLGHVPFVWNRSMGQTWNNKIPVQRLSHLKRRHWPHNMLVMMTMTLRSQPATCDGSTATAYPWWAATAEKSKCCDAVIYFATLAGKRLLILQVAEIPVSVL